MLIWGWCWKWQFTKTKCPIDQKFIDYDLNSSLHDNDTLDLDSSKYQLIAVDICNSNFRLRDNYITLCSGSKAGLMSDMGVISQTGLVGIIKKVSDNFSIVMSILHSQSSISCLIKRNNSNGMLIWKMGNPKILNLESIPKHKTVLVGDTVITSGYSTIFPKGIQVGKVKTVVLEPGSNSYTIEVELFNDQLPGTPCMWFQIVCRVNKKLEAEVFQNE